MKSAWKILLLLFFISCTPTEGDEKPHNAAELELERKALMALYDSAGGDQWLSAYRNSWGRGEVSNLWRGVFVDEQGYVVKLDLNNISLRGTLPEELGNLKHLKQCDLNNNMLTGKIPQSLMQNPNFNSIILGIIRQQEGSPGFDLSDVEYKLPEFTYKDIIGKTIKSVDEFAKSKFTVVLSWKTSDTTPEDFISTLRDFYNFYKTGDLEIIAFSRENTQTILNYCATEYIQWTNISDTELYAEKKLVLHNTPSAMVVDQEGRVVLDNVRDISTLKNFLREKLGSKSYYTSTDFSANGQKFIIQQSTKPNAVNILFMGDGFVDRDMNTGGKWEQTMREATEHFFSVEPCKSYREYFNVFAIKTVSKNEVFSPDSQTAFGVSFGEGTLIKGDNDLSIRYLEAAGLLFSNTLTTIVVNSPQYAGTCYLYNNGGAISFVPMVKKTADSDMDFSKVLLHESVGHGFAKLLDEYIYNDEPITESYKVDFLEARSMNLGFNMTVDRTNVPWQHFIGLSNYSMVGLYEGGYFFSRGIWRAEFNHCMNDNVPYFNAPSRELFVKRVKSLAGEVYSFSEFLAKDKYEPVQRSRRGAGKFVPLHPPVYVK